MTVAEFSLLAASSLFVIVDPIATAPAFLAMTMDNTQAQRAQMARLACATMAGVLLVFAVAGTEIFRFLGITLPAFQLAQQYGLPRLAHVGLQDQRVASYATALLKYSGFHVPESGPVGSPEESLWITEPSVHALEEIRQFVRERPGRRVIVVGQSPEEWNEPGIIMVDGSHRAMRKALQAASTEMSSV